MKIKCSCENCRYRGMYSVANQVASCDNDENLDRIVIHDDVFEKNRLGVKRTKWNEEVKCEHFIPEVEAEKEFETICNVIHKCPYCGNEDCEYDVNTEGDMFIHCLSCGHDYSIRW